MNAFALWRRISIYDRVLVLIFVLSLPLVNPWVRGDGVGYYAYARALVVNHNLQFEQDWLHANPTFRDGRIDAEGRIRADQYTATGHLNNHFAIGPALIWTPFLIITHCIVLAADHLGASIPANGFSSPYLDTMAVITALAGFVGLLISFHLARKYFPERWAFLATLGIWFASSLPVYMYFNPSWSHAQSAFAVALFLWYWDRTRGLRTLREWVVLGSISGLMMDMYYPNAVFLLVVVVELGMRILNRFRSAAPPVRRLKRGIGGCLLFTGALVFAFSPTLISRSLIYGNPFVTGYSARLWHFSDPSWMQVLFSADHGLFSWTPALLLASAGLLFLWSRDKLVALGSIASAATFYLLIVTYANWDGISSYGNRFFVSLTSIFILGLTALLASNEKLWHSKRAALLSAAAVIGLLIIWNFGLIFQWGMHLIPDRGPISWSEMVSNQFRVVPADMSESAARYFTGRHQLMQMIEKRDLQQLGEPDPKSEVTRAAK